MFAGTCLSVLITHEYHDKDQIFLYPFCFVLSFPFVRICFLLETNILPCVCFVAVRCSMVRFHRFVSGRLYIVKVLWVFVLVLQTERFSISCWSLSTQCQPECQNFMSQKFFAHFPFEQKKLTMGGCCNINTQRNSRCDSDRYPFRSHIIIMVSYCNIQVAVIAAYEESQVAMPEHIKLTLLWKQSIYDKYLRSCCESNTSNMSISLWKQQFIYVMSCCKIAAATAISMRTRLLW